MGNAARAGHLRLALSLGGSRQEEVECAGAGIVPCGLAGIVEQVSLVDGHLSATGLERAPCAC